MIRSLLSFLQDCYSSNGGNRSYAVIIRALQRMGGVPTLPNLVMALISSANAKTDFIAEDKIQGILDYRICNLSVRSLRKLQPPFGKNEFVGISFVQSKSTHRQGEYDNEPVSSLVLGANGIGKTSLFCSLEIAAFGSSNIARNHGYETAEQQRKFLSHNDGADNPTIRLCTKSGIIETTVGTGSTFPRSLNLPQAFLCSSYDISRLEKGGIDSEYMMKEMGKPEFLTLAKILKQTREVLNWLEEYRVADDLLSDTKVGSKDEISLQDRKGTFEKKIKKTLGIKRLSSAIFSLDSSYFKKLSKEIEEIILVLDLEIQRIFKTLLIVSKRIIPNILRDFLDDCELDISMVEEIPSISLSVKNDVDGQYISLEPRQFFNTFRLKLFAIALKISMSCCVKIVDRVNFPFIIDDTFDASDFVSKGKIKKFIGNILANHNLIEALERYPLQLIIFTQDDIIAQKAYQGLLYSMQPVAFKPIFYKVFDCKSATQDDFVKEEIGDNIISYYNIVDKIIG